MLSVEGVPRAVGARQRLDEFSALGRVTVNCRSIYSQLDWGGALRGGKLRPTAKSGAIGTRRANVEHVAPLDVSKLTESGWLNRTLAAVRRDTMCGKR